MNEKDLTAITARLVELRCALGSPGKLRLSWRGRPAATRIWLVMALLLASLLHAGPAGADPGAGGAVYLPLVMSGDACPPIPGESYGTVSVPPPPTDRPAEEHGDLNLALRGFVATTGHLGLVDYSGAADPAAPQLGWLFADRRAPVITSVHQVREWDWSCNCRGAPIGSPPVTLIGLAATSGESVHLPDSGYDIGNRYGAMSFDDGYEALVLYAATDRITLKYTRADNVVQGYTVHLEGICVAPDLLALYQQSDAAGRGRLPALRAGQALGRARDQVGVAIRDNGTFLDPRSRKDWWRGY
jgi:hypothetical protein